jgi:hypothetical protein
MITCWMSRCVWRGKPSIFWKWESNSLRWHNEDPPSHYLLEIIPHSLWVSRSAKNIHMINVEPTNTRLCILLPKKKEVRVYSCGHRQEVTDLLRGQCCRSNYWITPYVFLISAVSSKLYHCIAKTINRIEFHTIRHTCDAWQYSTR